MKFCFVNEINPDTSSMTNVSRGRVVERCWNTGFLWRFSTVAIAELTSKTCKKFICLQLRYFPAGIVFCVEMMSVVFEMRKVSSESLEVDLPWAFEEKLPFWASLKRRCATTKRFSCSMEAFLFMQGLKDIKKYDAHELPGYPHSCYIQLLLLLAKLLMMNQEVHLLLKGLSEEYGKRK